MKYQFDFDSAIKAGYTPQQIQEYMSGEQSRGAQYELPSTPQDVKFDQPKEGGLEDWLPTIGAVAGSFTPLGPILGGAAGAGLGTLAKQAIKGDFDAGEAVKETALGGVGGVVGKGIGSVASKILPKVGETAIQTGDNLALKALRPSKTQLTNFEKQHGEDMGQVVKRYNIIGKNATQIEDDAIKPLQESFNKIVDSSKIQIDPTDIDTKFYQKVSKLLESPATEDHKLAEKILLEYDSIISSVGNKPITGQMVNNFRKTFDGKVKSWLADPVEAGKNRIAGSALREVLQEAADRAGLDASGQSFKQAGMELSKLYNVRDLAELQSNLGRGNLPVGMLDLLGFGAGGAGMGMALGGPAGLAGAAAGAAGARLINSPKAIAAYSKLLSSAGGKLSSVGNVPEIISQGVGQGAVRLPMQIDQSNNNSNNQAAYDSSNNFHGGDSTTTIGQSQGLPTNPQDVRFSQNQGLGATPTLTGHSPSELYQGYIKALTAGDKTNAAQLRTMFEDETKFQKEGGKGSKSLSAASAQMLGKANAASSALQRVSGELLSNPNKLLLMATPGAPGARQLEADYSSLSDAIGGLRTGASVSKEQQAYYRNLLPKVGDSPQTIQSKLAAVEAELQFYIQNGSNITEPYGDLPASPQMVQF